MHAQERTHSEVGQNLSGQSRHRKAALLQAIARVPSCHDCSVLAPTSGAELRQCNRARVLSGARAGGAAHRAAGAQECRRDHQGALVQVGTGRRSRSQSPTLSRVLAQRPGSSMARKFCTNCACQGGHSRMPPWPRSGWCITCQGPGVGGVGMVGCGGVLVCVCVVVVDLCVCVCQRCQANPVP